MQQEDKKTDPDEFISIVIPVYNVEEYLDECLQSILHQTYRNYEVILIDDGSKDRSGEICDSYAAQYDCISVYHQTNQGQAAARNFGVEKAKSDWIAFVDSDDVAHPQMLEYLVRAQKQTEAKISACARVEGVELPEGFFETKPFLAENISISEESLYKLHDTDFYWALFPSLIHKSICQSIKMPVGRVFEDNAVCCQWLHRSGSLAIVPHSLYYYRKNPNSTMNRIFTPKRLDYLWALKEQLEFYDHLEYHGMLNLVFSDYLSASFWLRQEVIENLGDRKIAENILKECMVTARKYKKKIDSYQEKVVKVERLLHPTWYGIVQKFAQLLGHRQ